MYLDEVILFRPRLTWKVKQCTLSGENILHFTSSRSLLPHLSACENVSFWFRHHGTVSIIFQVRFCLFLDQRYFPVSNENALYGTSWSHIACVLLAHSHCIVKQCSGLLLCSTASKWRTSSFLRFLVSVPKWVTLQFMLAHFVPLVVKRDCCLSFIFRFFGGCFLFNSFKIKIQVFSNLVLSKELEKQSHGTKK